MTKAQRQRKHAQGSKWIRPEKRLAIYLRDGLQCVYCGWKLEENGGESLTLDHLKPQRWGGSNSSRNLVTCCRACNTARGTRSVEDWARSVWVGEEALRAILKRVSSLTRRSLKPYLAEAKRLSSVR